MDAMTKLYNLVKPLANKIPIYKNVMTEDDSSTPDSYILLIDDVTNNGRVYGDGKSIIRSSDCDIHLISKGTAKNTNSKHNVNRRKIDKLLNDAGIDWNGINLGYNNSDDYTEYTWSVNIIYG